jgi:hypothetical protein
VPSFLASVGPFQRQRPIFYAEGPICHVTAGGGHPHCAIAGAQRSVSLEGKRQSSAFVAAAFQPTAPQNAKMPKNKAIIAAPHFCPSWPFLLRNREFLIRSPSELYLYGVFFGGKLKNA